MACSFAILVAPTLTHWKLGASAFLKATFYIFSQDLGKPKNPDESFVDREKLFLAAGD